MSPTALSRRSSRHNRALRRLSVVWARRFHRFCRSLPSHKSALLFLFTNPHAATEIDKALTIRRGLITHRRRQRFLVRQAVARGDLFMRRKVFLISRLFQNRDRKSTRLNSSHLGISYAVFCLKKKK